MCQYIEKCYVRAVVCYFAPPKLWIQLVCNLPSKEESNTSVWFWLSFVTNKALYITCGNIFNECISRVIIGCSINVYIYTMCLIVGMEPVIILFIIWNIILYLCWKGISKILSMWEDYKEIFIYSDLLRASNYT